MTQPRPMRVLFVSALCDGTDVGEAYFSFRWAQQLAARSHLTVLSLARRGRAPLQDQLPDADVLTWQEPPILQRFERFNALLKPAYAKFYWKVRSYLRDAARAGRRFDIIHHMGPNSLRYPSPAVGFGIPVVHGPMQGGVPTPPGFSAETDSAAWYTNLRNLDSFRLRHDPWLRHSFANVDLLLVGAPYVLEALEGVPLKRVEVLNHLGIDGLVQHPAKRVEGGRLRLVHVGRGVRTKGLRDCIRAFGLLPDLPGVTLDVAGDGEEMPRCKALAESLGVSQRITFHGRLARAQIEALYGETHALLFPSFREPQGSVVLEAMRHGLPVITVDRGGPGYMVTESCGFRLGVESPDQLARDIAGAIRHLAGAPDLYARLSGGAYARAIEVGSWSKKMDTLLHYYQEMQVSHQR